MLWDGELKGFGLRIVASGTRTYILRYRMGGRDTPIREITIGQHGSPWTVDQARRRASELLMQVRSGRDPVAEREAETQRFQADRGAREKRTRRIAPLHYPVMRTAAAHALELDPPARTREARDAQVLARRCGDAMLEANGEAIYQVGVYGSGLVCETLLDLGLASKTFVAQSTRWTHSAEFRASGRWTVDQGPAGVVAGVHCDPDQAAIVGDIGDFALHAAHPYWMELANLNEGRSSFLMHEVAIARVGAPFNDAVHVPLLIELGSTAQGLAAARAIASKAIDG